MGGDGGDKGVRKRRGEGMGESCKEGGGGKGIEGEVGRVCRIVTCEGGARQRVVLGR